MKAEAIIREGRFQPVVLEIIFQNQGELDAFASLFNHTAITDTLDRLLSKDSKGCGEIIRDALTAKGANSSIFTKAITDCLRNHVSIRG